MMLNKFTALFQKPDSQLAEFLAPLPLDECAERLQSKDGKYFNIDTHVRVTQVDPDKYTFRMRVRIESRNILNATVVGSLNRQDETTTQVFIARGEDLYVHPLLTLAIFAVIGVVASVLIKSILAFLFMLALSLSIAYEEHNKYDTVVQTIQETLGVRTPKKKLKDKSPFV